MSEPTPARSLSSWSPRQLRVARQMAYGHSQVRAGELEEVPPRTVRYWIAHDALMDAVNILAERGWERLDPKLWRNIELALDTQAAVLRGELGERSGEAQEARWVLERALRRAPGIGAVDAGGAAPALPPAGGIIEGEFSPA